MQTPAAATIKPNPGDAHIVVASRFVVFEVFEDSVLCFESSLVQTLRDFPLSTTTLQRLGKQATFKQLEQLKTGNSRITQTLKRSSSPADPRTCSRRRERFPHDLLHLGLAALSPVRF